MTKLNWRLSKLPTPDEVRELVKDKIITQDEAREILFNLESEEERDKKSLESEIKFLREIIDKLAGRSAKLVEVIREVRVPYYQYQWVQPYTIWCGGNGGGGLGVTTSTAGTQNLVYTATSGTANLNSQVQALSQNTTSASGKFSDIKTF